MIIYIYVYYSNISVQWINNLFTELEFWNKRKNTFGQIYDQLRAPNVKKMAAYLQLTKSVYFNTYQEVCIGVVDGLF